MAISDVALKVDALPPALAANVEAYVGCISGAIPITQYAFALPLCALTQVCPRYQSGLTAAGFVDVEIVDSKSDLNVWKQGANGSEPFVLSLSISFGADGESQNCCPAVAIDTDEDLNALCASVKISARRP